jgi:hypothetical protein
VATFAALFALEQGRVLRTAYDGIMEKRASTPDTKSDQHESRSEDDAACAGSQAVAVRAQY